MSLNIALVDDHVLVRNAIGDLLRKNGHLIVCEADNGKILLDFLKKNQLPDIILLDINMPVMNGYETMECIAERYKHHKVIALSMYDDEKSIIRMIKAGASGYLLKESKPAELLHAINTVHQEGFYHSTLVNSHVLKLINYDKKEKEEKKITIQFNSKELEMLQLLCTEMSYKEIGSKLGISARTVETYRDNICQKTEINNRIGLVLYAIRNGLIKV